MINLLKAGFARLKKNTVFWCLIIISIAIAIVSMKVEIMMNSQINSGDIKDEGIDSFILNYIMLFGMFIAIFTSIFVGAEYSYGIIRNKLVVGHSRINIYFANLIISIVVSIIMEAIYIAFVAIFGTSAFGGLKMTANEFLYVLVRSLVIIIMYSSIFTLFTLLCTDMTFATIICLIYFCITWFFCTTLSMTVYQCKYINYEIYDEEGNAETIEEINPDYVGDVNMKLLRGIYCTLPMGQVYDLTMSHEFSTTLLEDADYLLYNTDKISDEMLLGYAIISVIIVNGIGICLFNRKEIK
jgi:ABC-type transport system involved in multi-copper enzyme maturation permease subunit